MKKNILLMTYMSMLALFCATISTTTYSMYSRPLQDDEVEVDVDCGTYFAKAIAKKPKTNTGPQKDYHSIPCTLRQQPPLQPQTTMSSLEAKALRKAVLENNIQQVRGLLNASPIVNSMEQGETALHIAAQSGNLDVVRLLLAYGANVDVTSEKSYLGISRTIFHMTPLHEAAAHGHDDIVVELLKKDSALEIYNDHLETPLHLAIKNGHIATAKLLLDHGANIDARTLLSRTALHIAAENNRPECLDLLLEYKVGIETQDQSHQTALHIASAHGHSDFVQQLLTFHPKLDEYDADHMTPLAYAFTNKDHALANALLANGAHHDIRMKDDQTLLHLAANNNDINGVNLLLDHHCDINAKNSDQKTAVHIAAAKGYHDIAQILLEHGAGVDVTDGNSNTALHMAVKREDVQMVELLLQHSANPNLFNYQNFTAVHIAAQNNNSAMIELLAHHHADLNANRQIPPLYMAITHALKESDKTLITVKTLIRLGANIHENAESSSAGTILQVAAWSHNTQLVKLFLDQSNSPEFACNYLDGLLAAAFDSHRDILRLFLDHGGYRNAPDMAQRISKSILWELNTGGYRVVRTYLEYNIPLPPKFFHAVIASGQLDLVQTMVLQKGADLTERSNEGLLPEEIDTTPEIRAFLTSTAPYTLRLVQAIDQGDYQEFSTCLDHGAQLTFRDQHGNTPLHHATEYRRLEMIKDLIIHGADPAAQNNAGVNPVAIAANNPDCLHMFMHAAMPMPVVERRILNNRTREIFDGAVRLDEHVQQHNRIRAQLNASAQRIGKYVSLGAGIGLGGLALRKVIQTWRNVGFRPAGRQALVLTGITGILCTLLYKYVPQIINNIFEPRRTREIRAQLNTDEQVIRRELLGLRQNYTRDDDRRYIHNRLSALNRLDRNRERLQTEQAQQKYAETIAYFN